MTNNDISKGTTLSLMALAGLGGLWYLSQRNIQIKRARAKALTKGFNKFQKEAEEAVFLALKCGEAMRNCIERKSQETNWKDDGGIDPVTKTDVENEQLVTFGLMKQFPNYKIIGEEAAAQAGYIPAVDSSSLTWIIDPIDGTQNFVHGTPLSVVSIGLFDPNARNLHDDDDDIMDKTAIKGRPVLGVVYDPYKDEMFIAVQGEGAYLNGTPITCDSSIKTLQKASVVCDFGYDRSLQGIKRMTSAVSKLMNSNTQSLRIYGSSVLSLVWVATGRANAFVIGFNNEGGKPWDYCAAHVIASEAGCHFKQLDARTYANMDIDTSNFPIPPHFDIYSRSCICASTSELVTEIFDVVTSKCSLSEGL